MVRRRRGGGAGRRGDHLAHGARVSHLEKLDAVVILVAGLIGAGLGVLAIERKADLVGAAALVTSVLGPVVSLRIGVWYARSKDQSTLAEQEVARREGQ